MEKNFELIAGEPKIVRIDRSENFGSTDFIGGGWKIAEQDERSLEISEIDPAKIRLVNCLEENENLITGEEELKRLGKTGHVRLDAKIFQALWENQELIPEHWKKKTNGKTTFITFDGTVFSISGGERYVICLAWGGERWFWFTRWLSKPWGANRPSAVIEDKRAANSQNSP